MEQEQASRPNAELATRFMVATLDEAAGLLKLYFTVTTGAFVLFTNLIAGSHAPRPILAVLTISILAFGASALFCLRGLLGLVKLRAMFTEAVSTAMSIEQVERKAKDWSSEIRKPMKWMERLFFVGVAASAIFVVSLVFVR